MTNTENTFGSMDQVVVRRDDLLKILRENLEKHDTIFDASVSGYWVEVDKKLQEKKTEFEEKVKDVNEHFAFCYDKTKLRAGQKKQTNSFENLNANLNFNNSFGLAYPQNHADDYSKVIRMAELSVHNEFKLSSTEFDCYVLNRWAWKDMFKTTALSYIGNLGTGCYTIACSGMAVKF